MCALENASSKDIPQLCELLAVLFAQEREFAPDAEAQRAGLLAILNDNRAGTILVARANERILAMVVLLFTVSTALGARVALLEDMVVHPVARGTGLGTALLEKAIAVARASGCKRITLLTDSDNIRAQSFYARLGFVRSDMIPMRLLLN